MASSQFCYWVKDTVLNVRQIECAKPNINLGKCCLIRNGFLSTQLLSGIPHYRMLKRQEENLYMLFIYPVNDIFVQHLSYSRESCCIYNSALCFAKCVECQSRYCGQYEISTPPISRLITSLAIRLLEEEMIVLLERAEGLVNRWESGGTCRYPALPHRWMYVCACIQTLLPCFVFAFFHTWKNDMPT